jgi:hypothetical protein
MSDSPSITRSKGRSTLPAGPRGMENQRWVEELAVEAQRLRANPRWIARYRRVVERLKTNFRLTLQDELAAAQAEDPESFVALLMTLVDRRHITRQQACEFIDENCGAITLPVFRNAVLRYRRLFLATRKSVRH